jgi:hypothetical protein
MWFHDRHSCLTFVYLLALASLPTSAHGAWTPAPVEIRVTSPGASQASSRPAQLSPEQLADAAQDSVVAPLQRGFMIGMSPAGLAEPAEAERSRTSYPESATTADGVWVQDPPPSARYLHIAVYDLVHDRMVVFGGYAKGYDLVNDVWALSLAGSPAWTKLNPSGTPPSPRHLQSAIYDPVRNRVVVFGGYQRGQPPFLNDVWALSLGDSPAWQRLTPAGIPPIAREGHSAIYDARHDRMIVFGGYQYSGYRGATAGPLNDVWALSLSGSPAWTQLSPAGERPPPRSAHSAIYDPIHHRMVVFGGSGGGLLNDTWELTLEGNPRWTQITPTGTSPSPRLQHAAIYDPSGRRMAIFGGFDNGYTGDTWALSLTGRPEWNLITPSGAQPSGRSGPTAIYDPMRLRVVVFGGTPDGRDLLNDVWGLTLAGGPIWANLTPPGTPPAGLRVLNTAYDPVRDRMVVLGGNDEVWARSLAGSLMWTRLVAAATPSVLRQWQTAIYDPVRDRIVVFGGSTSPFGQANDVWALSLSGNPAWVQLIPTGTPPSVREKHTAIYDPVRDRMVVYAGVNSQHYLGDVWALSLAGNPTWTQLAPTGTPPNLRYRHSAIYDPFRDRMIVFGGFNGASLLNDTWELSFAGYPAWTRLAPTARLPGPNAAAIYDPIRDRMVVHGLRTGANDDVWALSLAGSPAWTVLAPVGTAPGSGSTAMYDPLRDRMIVCANDDVWHLDWVPLTLPPIDPLSPPLSIGDQILSPVLAYPNPSRGDVTISFRLARTSETTLRIFDAAGRVARTLVSGTLPAGPRSIRWDRRVASGALARPGVYIYELQADGHRAARRLVLIR